MDSPNQKFLAELPLHQTYLSIVVIGDMQRINRNEFMRRAAIYFILLFSLLLFDVEFVPPRSMTLLVYTVIIFFIARLGRKFLATDEFFNATIRILENLHHKNTSSVNVHLSRLALDKILTILSSAEYNCYHRLEEGRYPAERLLFRTFVDVLMSKYRLTDEQTKAATVAIHRYHDGLLPTESVRRGYKFPDGSIRKEFFYSDPARSCGPASAYSFMRQCDSDDDNEE